MSPSVTVHLPQMTETQTPQPQDAVGEFVLYDELDNKINYLI